MAPVDCVCGARRGCACGGLNQGAALLDAPRVQTHTHLPLVGVTAWRGARLSDRTTHDLVNATARSAARDDAFRSLRSITLPVFSETL